jgi:hypothetical protein
VTKIINHPTGSLLVERHDVVYFWSLDLNAACRVVCIVTALLAEIVLAMNNFDDAKF